MARGCPPTKTEAIRLARADPTIDQLLEAGGEVVVVEPKRGRGLGDRTVVGIHDPKRGRSLVAMVAPDGVIGVRETPATFQLSQQERTTAEKLAAADERTKAFLRRRRMKALVTSTRRKSCCGKPSKSTRIA